jgi:hypothetical protein
LRNKIWQKLNKKKLRIGDCIQLTIINEHGEVDKNSRRSGATGVIIDRDIRWGYEDCLTALPDKKEWENPGTNQFSRNWCIRMHQPINDTRFEKIGELSIDEMLTSSYESLRKEGLQRKKQQEKLYNRFLIKIVFLKNSIYNCFKRKIL